MLRPLIAIIFLSAICLTGCTQASDTPHAAKENANANSGDYWVSFVDDSTGECGYKNAKGDVVIPLAKYGACFTDTFRTYAVVIKAPIGFVAIDRQENVLYNVFYVDNGPDYPADGLFRIVKKDKIGYADVATGKVIIEPKFDCAWPFENGKAKVSINCRTEADGEHRTWVSEHWYYVDKAGKVVEQ